MCYLARGAAPGLLVWKIGRLSNRVSMSGGKGREAKVYTELSSGAEGSEMTGQQNRNSSIPAVIEHRRLLPVGAAVNNIDAIQLATC